VAYFFHLKYDVSSLKTGSNETYFYKQKITPNTTKKVLFLVAVTFNISRNHTIIQQVKSRTCMTEMTGKLFFKDFLLLKEQLIQHHKSNFTLTSQLTIPP
jgi:hypothetical protein